MRECEFSGCFRKKPEMDEYVAASIGKCDRCNQAFVDDGTPHRDANNSLFSGIHGSQLSVDDMIKRDYGISQRSYEKINAQHQPETSLNSNPVYDNILQEAHVITEGARASDYGNATQSFTRIAMIANVAIGRNLSLTPQDVVKVLMAVKLVRESFKHKRDNLVDLCGYARLLQDIEDDLANMEPNCKPANS